MNTRFPKMIRDVAPEGEIVHTSKVAHVTFYIIKHPTEERYKLFSESEKNGAHELDPCEFEHNYLDYFESYEDATNALAKAQIDLENILERKRDGFPTQKQLMFFFRNKMPIPIDLTWGQASDLIDDKLAQIARDKQTRRLERFNGFTEGDRVSFRWGKEIITGCITKLYQAGSAGKFVQVGAENGTLYRFQDFDKLQKAEVNNENV